MPFRYDLPAFAPFVFASYRLRRRYLEAQDRLRDAVLIFRGRELDLRLGLLQLRLAQFHNRAESKVVASLRQIEGQDV